MSEADYAAFQAARTSRRRTERPVIAFVDVNGLIEPLTDDVKQVIGQEFKNQIGVPLDPAVDARRHPARHRDGSLRVPHLSRGARRRHRPERDRCRRSIPGRRFSRCPSVERGTRRATSTSAADHDVQHHRHRLRAAGEVRLGTRSSQPSCIGPWPRLQVVYHPRRTATSRARQPEHACRWRLHGPLSRRKQSSSANRCSLHVQRGRVEVHASSTSCPTSSTSGMAMPGPARSRRRPGSCHLPSSSTGGGSTIVPSRRSTRSTLTRFDRADILAPGPRRRSCRPSAQGEDNEHVTQARELPVPRLQRVAPARHSANHYNVFRLRRPAPSRRVQERRNLRPSYVLRRPSAI